MKEMNMESKAWKEGRGTGKIYQEDLVSSLGFRQ
jgi:hypothetical protein